METPLGCQEEIIAEGLQEYNGKQFLVRDAPGKLEKWGTCGAICPKSKFLLWSS